MTQKREEIHFRTIFLTTFSSSRVLTRSHTESPAFESAGNEDSSLATKMSQLHTFGQQADWIFLDGKYFLLPNVDHRQQRRIKERKILTVSAAERLRCRVWLRPQARKTAVPLESPENARARVCAFISAAKTWKGVSSLSRDPLARSRSHFVHILLVFSLSFFFSLFFHAGCCLFPSRRWCRKYPSEETPEILSLTGRRLF